MNPENKCAHLFNQDVPDPEDKLEAIMNMQSDLQKRYGKDPKDWTLLRRVEGIKENFHHLCMEYAELMERLPHKHWKTYSEAEKLTYINEEQKLEIWYEWCDMFHFFINMGLLLGIKPEDAFRLYATKNKENFDRQDRGY